MSHSHLTPLLRSIFSNAQWKICHLPWSHLILFYWKNTILCCNIGSQKSTRLRWKKTPASSTRDEGAKQFSQAFTWNIHTNWFTSSKNSCRETQNNIWKLTVEHLIIHKHYKFHSAQIFPHLSYLKEGPSVFSFNANLEALQSLGFPTSTIIMADLLMPTMSCDSDRASPLIFLFQEHPGWWICGKWNTIRNVQHGYVGNKRRCSHIQLVFALLITLTICLITSDLMNSQ